MECVPAIRRGDLICDDGTDSRGVDLRCYDDDYGDCMSEPYCPPFETGEDLKEAITMYIDTPVDSRDDPNVNPCGSIELWYVVFERTCRSMA